MAEPKQEWSDFLKHFSTEQRVAWEELVESLEEISQTQKKYEKENSVEKRAEYMKKMSAVGQKLVAAMNILNK